MQPEPLRICTPASAALHHNPQGQNETTNALVSSRHRPPKHLRILAASCPQQQLCEPASQPVCAEVTGWTTGPQMSGSQSSALCLIYLRAVGPASWGLRPCARAEGCARPSRFHLSSNRQTQPQPLAVTLLTCGCSGCHLCTNSTWSKPWATPSGSWVPVMVAHLPCACLQAWGFLTQSLSDPESSSTQAYLRFCHCGHKALVPTITRHSSTPISPDVGPAGSAQPTHENPDTDNHSHLCSFPKALPHVVAPRWAGHRLSHPLLTPGHDKPGSMGWPRGAPFPCFSMCTLLKLRDIS